MTVKLPRSGLYVTTFLDLSANALIRWHIGRQHLNIPLCTRPPVRDLNEAGRRSKFALQADMHLTQPPLLFVLIWQAGSAALLRCQNKEAKRGPRNCGCGGGVRCGKREINLERLFN